MTDSPSPTLYLVRLRKERRLILFQGEYADEPLQVFPPYEAAFVSRDAAKAWAARNPHQNHNPFRQELCFFGGGQVTMDAPHSEAADWNGVVFDAPLAFFRDWLRDVFGIETPAGLESCDEWRDWYDQAQTALSQVQKQSLWDMLAPDAYEIVEVNAPTGILPR